MAIRRGSSRAQAEHETPVVALIMWGLTIEDFLEPTGLTLEQFCSEFRGSWMFGYVEALASAGVETRLVCISRSVATPSWMTHRPSGARLLALPVPPLYRVLRKATQNPYARTTRGTFGAVRGLVGWPLLAPLKELAPFAATPVRQLFGELGRERVRAILCQEYEFPRFDVCTLAGKARGLPVFGVFQGGDYRRWRAESLTRRGAIRRCDGLVIGSRTEAERVKALYGISERKIARIVNPVDAELWRPGDRSEARAALGLPPDARIAVWHGRVQLPKKGIDVLLDAWSSVCRDRPRDELRLVLVGDGEHAGLVEAQIDRIGLSNVVFVRRLIHDPAELRVHLTAGDVYVFPSRHEGVPVAPIEAMACGLPVVATDTGGVRDILGEAEQRAGIIVPREDPAALSNALRSLLEDENLSRSLGSLARRRVVEEFSLDAVGRKLRAFVVDRS
jgi:starch synthase